jgi:hypothetical protein
VADDLEQVLVLPVNNRALAAFGTPAGCEVRRGRDEAGLADYAEIGRSQPEGERRELAAILRRSPDTMSVHIAYVDGEPTAGGRIHFRAGGSCAELARIPPRHLDQALRLRSRIQS